jgi:guanyl-specific ribonuclease Sa
MAKQKASIPTLRVSHLPADVRRAISKVKTRIRSSIPPTVFRNEKHQLPRPSQGCQYREFRVGNAHPGDSRPAGKRRLVLEINVKGREVREIYFTDHHYMPGSFRRLV